MCSIEVRCFATLSGYAPPDGRMELAAPCTVGDAMRLLGVPVAEVAILFVNGVHADPDAPLHDGDRLGLFPPVGGG